MGCAASPSSVSRPDVQPPQRLAVVQGRAERVPDVREQLADRRVPALELARELRGIARRRPRLEPTGDRRAVVAEERRVRADERAARPRPPAGARRARAGRGATRRSLHLRWPRVGHSCPEAYRWKESMSDSGTPIAVTGATGQLGRLVVRHLADLGAPMRLLVRDPARAPEIAGAEVVAAEYEHPHDVPRGARRRADGVPRVRARGGRPDGPAPQRRGDDRRRRRRARRLHVVPRRRARRRRSPSRATTRSRSARSARPGWS